VKPYLSQLLQLTLPNHNSHRFESVHFPTRNKYKIRLQRNEKRSEKEEILCRVFQGEASTKEQEDEEGVLHMQQPVARMCASQTLSSNPLREDECEERQKKREKKSKEEEEWISEMKIFKLHLPIGHISTDKGVVRYRHQRERSVSPPCTPTPHSSPTTKHTNGLKITRKTKKERTFREWMM